MKHHPARRTVRNIAVALLAAGTAQAAVAAISIDLNLGPNKLIPARSLQFGGEVTISAGAGGFGGRGARLPRFSDIAWTQAMDGTYPPLLRRTLTGDIIEEAKIELRSPLAQGGTPYLALSASHAGLTGVSFANDTVSGSMNFDKLTMTYDPAGFGKPGVRISTTYDLLTGKSSGATSRATTNYAGTEPASAGQTAIYLRLGDGPAAIAGEANAIGYENWIKLGSAQMGVGMNFVESSTGAPRRAGIPSISDMTISHQFTAAVPALFGAFTTRSPIGNATIEYVTVDGAGPVTFMQILLENVIVNGFALSTGGEPPNVSESLNFTGFSQTVWEIDSNGRRGKATTVGYSIIDGKATPGRLAASVPGFGAGNLTGALTSSAAGSAAGLEAAPVPEPETWVMLLAGVGVLAAAVRRRTAG